MESLMKIVVLSARLALAALLVGSFSACDGNTPGTDGGDGDGDTGDGDGDGDGDGNDAGTGDGDGDGDGDLTPICTEAADVPCEDQHILALNLNDVASTRGVSNMADGDGFISVVDATAGGFMGNEGYVYVKFTEEGLVTVGTSDEDSFYNMDWDLGFRRYIVRLNSGVSGPSCVSAARLSPGTNYEALTELPDGLDGLYRTEEYFSEGACELIPDGSGLPDAPATALASFWEYPGCVQMTGNVFVIQLADGHHVKFEVLAYYYEAVQQECQDFGTYSTMPSGSGNMKVRWAYLD